MKSLNVRVYGILIHENKLLVSDEYIKGMKITKLPGGGLEHGEGTIDCLKREFKEELNLDVEIIDLRTLNPLDEEAVFNSVRKNSRCMVLTEECWKNSFAEALAGRISKVCFQYLDAPVEVIGSENLPAIPLNAALEQAMIPNAGKVEAIISRLLNY